MTDAPSFLRRKPKPDPIETGLMEILTNLRAKADQDVHEVLASATNTYMQALIRFTGQSSLVARDVDYLLRIWQILLDVNKDRTQYGKAEPAKQEDPTE